MRIGGYTRKTHIIRGVPAYIGCKIDRASGSGRCENCTLYKKSGNTTFDLDGLGAYAGFHFGKPVLLGLGYEAG
ncbi:MAG: hypothetical protein P8Q23_06000, partial [Paracoccaceae bacterium]|nr:hypothetical protein [Paracoccaceae bacterium]